MTNPGTGNSRFNPTMDGAIRTPAEMIRDADDARKYAEALAIQQQQSGVQALLFDYQLARDANQASARDVSPDVFERVQRFTFRLNDITQTATRAVRELVPMPRDPAAVRGPYQAQVDYSASRITDGLAAQDAMVAAALADASEQEANAIVDLAWVAAAPAAPDRALSGEVDDALEAIRLALSPTAGNQIAANSAAQTLLRAAVGENDQAMIYALLGGPSRRLLTALQVNKTTLARVWAEKMIAAIKVDANGVAPLSGDIHGGEFLRLQAGDQALVKLPQMAKAFYTAQRKLTDALLKTQLVRESTRP